MRDPAGSDARLSKAVSFGGSAIALGLAAFAGHVACPGGCVSCTSCVAGAVPALASVLAVGGALAGSHAFKKRLHDEPPPAKPQEEPRVAASPERPHLAT